MTYFDLSKLNLVWKCTESVRIVNPMVTTV